MCVCVWGGGGGGRGQGTVVRPTKKKEGKKCGLKKINRGLNV